MRFSKLLGQHADISGEPWLTFNHYPTANLAHPSDPTHAPDCAV